MGVFDVLLNALDVDAAIVTDPADMTYLSGYDNADCVIVVTRDRAVYFTDARYTEEAARTVGEKLKVVDGRLAPDALQAIAASGAKRVAFDSRLDFASYRLIAACASENAFELVPCDGVAAKLRIVKSRAEIDAIERAQEITDNAFEEILPLIREGIAEYELAAKLEYAILSKGAKLAFDSIVAFGENGSSPHAHRSDRRLKRGDFVTMDFGAKWQGYCSDMTRTVALGEITDMQRKAYQSVLAANVEGVAAVKAGVACRDVDAKIRKLLAKDGLDKFFVHSLGHGVGIDIHELPNLSPRSELTLQRGNVVTIEPGVYIEGSFGIRIEDLVVVEEGGCIDLTRSDKNLIIL